MYKITEEDRNICLKYFRNTAMTRIQSDPYVAKIQNWKKSEDPNSGWVHCSFNLQGNRKQYLKAYKENGSTKYEQIL